MAKFLPRGMPDAYIAPGYQPWSDCRTRSAPRGLGRTLRRLTTAFLALVIACTALLSVPPAPAASIIFTIITADENEDPTTQFTDANALTAFVNAGLFGGTICVIRPVENPGDGSLSCPGVWGTPNQIGPFFSGFTLIEPPDTMEVGTWMLLGDGDQGAQDALSVPFTVSACTVNCSKEFANARVAEWKASATAMADASGYFCTATKMYSLFRKIKYSRRIFARYHAEGELDVGSTLKLTASLNNIPTSSLSFYMAVLGFVSCRVEQMQRDIVADPADPLFQSVVDPEFATLPVSGHAGADALAMGIDRVHGFGRAQLVSFERYLGAAAAAEQPYVHAQAAAVAAYASEMAIALSEQVAPTRAFAAELAADPDGSNPIVTAAEFAHVLEVRQRVVETGFTAEEAQPLIDAGMTADEIEEFRQSFGEPLSDAIVGRSIESVLNELADEFEAQAEAMELFGRHAAVVANRNNLPPIVSFTADPTQSSSVPLNVHFMDTSSSPDLDPIVSRTWDFGDGETAEGQEVSHTYTTTGTYTARLTVCDYLACDAVTQLIFVGTTPPNQPPTASFTATPASGTAPLAVAFDAAASSDPDGDSLTYAWDFGDGAVGTGMTTSHTYDLAGTYTVTLTVSDGIASDIAEQTITVGASAQLTLIKTVDNTGGGTATATDWTLSATGTTSISGTTGSAAVTNAVVSPGTYILAESGPPGYTASAWSCTGRTLTGSSVVLAAGDTVSCTISNTFDRPANHQPVAVDDAYDAVAGEVLAPLSSILDNDSDADGDTLVAELATDVSHGSLFLNADGTFSYTATAGFAGTDMFTYRASDSIATSNIATVTFTVTLPKVPPVAAFTMSPPSGLIPLTLFVDASESHDPDGEILIYEWDFGDGARGSGMLASHQYTTLGLFEVVLTVTDDDGQTATASQFVRTIDPDQLIVPICGDQDGSEQPLVFQCPSYEATPEVQAYRVPGAGPLPARFDFIYRDAGFANELGVIVVDGPDASVEGIAPGESGYLTAAFDRAQVIFASGSDAFAPDTTITFQGGDYVMFYLIANATTEAFLDGNPTNSPQGFPHAFFTVDALNPDKVDHVMGFRHLEDGSVQFSFEDLFGGGDFDYNDIVYNAYAALTPVPILAVTKTAETAAVDPGAPSSYEITISNSGVADAIVDSIVDTLPAGFSYIAGSTAGVTTENPDINDSQLTWTGPFAVAAGGTIGLSFEVLVSTSPGTFHNEVTVTFGTAASSTGPTAPVVIGRTNAPPDLVSPNDQTIDEQVPFTLAVSATDPDGDALTYSLVNGPTGLVVSSTGTIDWTPTEAQGPGTYPVTVRVTDDGTPALFDDATFSITVREVNRAPVLAAIYDAIITVGDTFGVTASATDPDLPANALVYSLVTAPAGATIDAASGEISWTPGAAAIGPNLFTVRVTDDGSPALSDEETFLVTVLGIATELTYTGDTTGQYSDWVTLSAALTRTDTDMPLAGQTIAFTLGSLTASGTTDASGVAEATVQLTLPASTRSVTVDFTGQDGITGSSDSAAFEIGREDATLEYIGETIALVGNNLTLRARVMDSAAFGYVGPNPETDPTATIGDITKIWVAFSIYPAGSCMTGTPVATRYAQVVDTGTLGDGIGVATATYSSSTEAAYCVVLSIVAGSTGGTNDWYAAPPAQAAGIVFYKPSGQFVTGGGWILDAAGSHGNFGFNARYAKSGAPKGQMVYIDRGEWEGRAAIVIVKSNALTGLRFSGTEFPISATLEGKASVKVIDAASGEILYEAGNFTFSATVVDSGQSSGIGADSFGLVVWDRNSDVFRQISESLLGGGNVVIHPPKN